MNIRTAFFALTVFVAGFAVPCFGQAPITIGATDGPVTIIGVEIPGLHSNQAHILPGANFQLHFFYTIVDTQCPSCDDEIQIGFANSTPSVCAYEGNPGIFPNGVTAAATVTLTAPTKPGTYYIAFDRAQDFGCPTNGWWNGTPKPNQYIAAISVFW